MGKANERVDTVDSLEAGDIIELKGYEGRALTVFPLGRHVVDNHTKGKTKGVELIRDNPAYVIQDAFREYGLYDFILQDGILKRINLHDENGNISFRKQKEEFEFTKVYGTIKVGDMFSINENLDKLIEYHGIKCGNDLRGRMTRFILGAGAKALHGSIEVESRYEKQMAITFTLDEDENTIYSVCEFKE